MLRTTGKTFTRTLPNDTYAYITPQPSSMSSRYVLITGASGVLGRAMAVSYAKAGVAGLALSGRNMSALKQTADAVTAQGKCELLLLTADTTSQTDVERMAEEVKEKWGRLDVLVNNAGLMETPRKIANSEPSEWWKTFEVNVFGTFLMCRSFVPLLLAPSASMGLKTIVQISSGAAHVFTPGASAYQSSKTWLLRFNDFLTAEYADEGLLAYSVHPGGVATEVSKNLPEETRGILNCTPELAGDSVVWLSRVRRDWLADRYVCVQWDMEEFEKRKEEVVEQNLFRVRLRV
ncbi:NAD(P)-binding protein [Pseudovirgaria hyperparasitica]|uniref:NAD(P)-binding protein n=1 Tax=Pseudovirgaria hyperparasitica TaxID=470096 RepID=A0A6A6WCG7_9PEZI|nr:NAD(P)-binding protein [Pseudovirgaria hyperparasitica]KAF2760265.1 NAD(P)-binding protein [Pseudovirgaria hyperparasitica]